MPHSREHSDRRNFTCFVLALAMVVAGALSAPSRPATAATADQRLDLRVLVLDDDSAWVDALQGQLDAEGVPYTAVPLGASNRPVITAAFLSDGDRGFFQAVIAPNERGGIGPDELAALRQYEAKFAVREVNAFTFAHPGVGLNYAEDPGIGDLGGKTATVTAAGKANGFQYLDGPVQFSQGSYSYVATPLAGAAFTPLVTAPMDAAGSPGSILGVYAHDGVEQLVITAAMGSHQTHFRILAHGIISWATKGVHLGYNRNRLTVHVDDAFAEIALWNRDFNCTPTEDCPRDADGNSIYPGTTARMTAADVEYAVQWQRANGYTMTMAFNGSYARAGDPLTDAFVANKSEFRWLNHGGEHLYQGCVQDFSVVPWRCVTDANGALQWVPQDVIHNEIVASIATGQRLGLPFNPREYLSGEHSGLEQLPQQPGDNPNFATALTQADIGFIGADSSRPLDATSRQVGSALTVPRHPTILYYNAATVAQEVDEFNWLYLSRANGGSGYCEDNPATATCIAAPLTVDGFESTIVPNDVTFNLNFILGNDPRPYFAHTSNLTADRILYPWLDEMLRRYRTAFADNAPLVNQTLTEAAVDLQRQAAWKTDGMGANPLSSAYIQGGLVVVTKGGTSDVPITVPDGVSVVGATLSPYAGEMSGWLSASSTIGTQRPTLQTTGSTTFLTGVEGSVSFTVATTPKATMSQMEVLPPGLQFRADGNGLGIISGTPSAEGTYPILIVATTGSGSYEYPVKLVVNSLPGITSASSAAALTGEAFDFAVTSSGSPTPTITMTGALPQGVSFSAPTAGTAKLSGTATTGTGGTYQLTFTATSTAGTMSQAFTLSVSQQPTISSSAATPFTVGTAGSFTVRSEAFPNATLTMSGSLPAGVTFTPNATDGTGVLSGRPVVGTNGEYRLVFTATNRAGSTSQNFVLTVREAPKITSANSVTFPRQRSSFTITTTGWPLGKISSKGSLPPGMTFTDNGNGTATIAGTPTRTGTWTLTITVRNQVGSATQNLTVRVT